MSQKSTLKEKFQQFSAKNRDGLSRGGMALSPLMITAALIAPLDGGLTFCAVGGSTLIGFASFKSWGGMTQNKYYNGNFDFDDKSYAVTYSQWNALRDLQRKTNKEMAKYDTIKTVEGREKLQTKIQSMLDHQKAILRSKNVKEIKAIAELPKLKLNKSFKQKSVGN